MSENALTRKLPIILITMEIINTFNIFKYGDFMYLDPPKVIVSKSEKK